MIKSIDINADLGEGAGLDAKIMPLISSCSIACGGHFGDSESMLETLLLAKKHQVKVGAHPSFPDRDNFGRKVITLTKRELTDTVFHQLLHFFAICETEDIPVHHIKLHGALYNYAAIDAPTADAVVEAIVATKILPKLYVPYHSILAKKAENLLPLVYEAFIDRRYTDALSLVPRTDKNAVIDAAELAWNQLYEIIHTGYVTTISGEKRELIASTFCIHGDHENSVEILKYIRKQLNLHQILVS